MRYDVMYVEGPGDVVDAFESWRSGRELESETSVTYSSQLFAHCEQHGLSFLALSYGPNAACVQGPGFFVQNMPRRMWRWPKIGYHASLTVYALRLLAKVLRHRPSVLYVTSGVAIWNLTRLFELAGARVVPVLHNALWPEGFPPAKGVRDVGLWRCAEPPVTLVVSAAIRRQLTAVNPRTASRVIEFRPTFRETEFPVLPAPGNESGPFRIVFAGRLEEDKGAIDLVAIACALQRIDPDGFVIDICGDGSKATQVGQAVEAGGLAGSVVMWGRLDRESLVKRYQAAHVCIVPTRSTFCEGFAQVVAESILLLRPVVTSGVVPASEPYAAAIALAHTDNVASYVEALVALRSDRSRYEALVQACRDLRPVILGTGSSFQSALRESHLRTVRDGAAMLRKDSVNPSSSSSSAEDRRLDDARVAASSDRLAVVVIGRNEGERLRACLASVLPIARTVVYVDSGSTDASIETAAGLGAEVVRLDMAKPFTAARARNEGFRRLRERAPTVEFVQFVDGDCEVVAGWCDAAIVFLDARPEVGVVCGRRRERWPERAIYNRLCDDEWNTPVGEALACGGDAAMRVAAFEQVAGFRDELIAGEEPELCVRLRAAGWKVWRLDAEMTLHDAAMTRFSQWWRRCQRAGFAFAEGAFLHGAAPERHWVRERRSAKVWGLAIPAVLAGGMLVVGPAVAWGWLIYPAQVLRLAMRASGRPWHRLSRAFFLVLGKFPEALGQLRFLASQRSGRRARLIEYR